MNQYTIYCTEEQTKKAIELGAPINHGNYRLDCDEFSPIGDVDGVWMYAIIPTAEQMIGFILDTKKGNLSDLIEFIQSLGYKQGCLTFIDNSLK